MVEVVALNIVTPPSTEAMMIPISTVATIFEFNFLHSPRACFCALLLFRVTCNQYSRSVAAFGKAAITFAMNRAVQSGRGKFQPAQWSFIAKCRQGKNPCRPDKVIRHVLVPPKRARALSSKTCYQSGSLPEMRSEPFALLRTDLFCHPPLE